jgi:Tfp pilus assembly protein PilE
MLKNIRSVSLIELISTLMILSLIIMGIYNIESFSTAQVIDSDRRARVQNNLSYCLEHMGKYIEQANGDINNPPIEKLQTGYGFRVRVDFNSPQTPEKLNDDVWINYYLSGNTLQTSCTAIGTGSCNTYTQESLSNKIVSDFSDTVMPNNPDKGFYVYVDPLGNLVNIGLVGRFDPTKDVISSTTRSPNPQVEMKSKNISFSSSSH